MPHSSRSLGSYLRPLGVVALISGIFFAGGRDSIDSQQAWAELRSFELDGDECQALRDRRSTTTLAAAPEEGVPITVGEVAESFGLELALVCAANDLPAGCRDSVVDFQAEPFTLPLYRRQPNSAPEADEP